jgi:hypothetical protein
MRLGILDTLALAATLIFAVPVGLYGVESVLAGRPTLGVGLLVVAILMVVLPHRLTTPADVPGAVAERLVGSAVADPEEDRE